MFQALAAVIVTTRPTARPRPGWEHFDSGNGEDYKQISRSEKAWEIEAYPLLLSEIRSALGSRIG